MNNSFSVEQIAKTGDLNADLIVRQYRMDKIAKFMEIKCTNLKLKQNEIAKELAKSTSPLQRYRREKNMHSLYRILQSSNTHRKKQKSSNYTENDLKMTSNALKETQTNQL